MMVEERNGNVYSQRVANQIQMKMNSCPFTPHNFKLAYDLEGYENEKTYKMSSVDTGSNGGSKVQMKIHMENHNSRLFFEAMKLKNMSRHAQKRKTSAESSSSTGSANGSPHCQPTGKFYHLSFEPMRIEDYKELEGNRSDDDDLPVTPSKYKISTSPEQPTDRFNNNNNGNYNIPSGDNRVSDNNNPSYQRRPAGSHFLSNNSSTVSSPIKRPVIVGAEDRAMVLSNTNASKFIKRGGSRKLPSLPFQAVPFTRLSSTMPDLIANTKIPSLADEILHVYNQDKKNFQQSGCNFVLPHCFYLDHCSNRPSGVPDGRTTMDDLGIPEAIDPIKKYSDLYLNESYVRAIICFLSSDRSCHDCPKTVADDVNKLESEENLAEEISCAEYIGPDDDPGPPELDVPMRYQDQGAGVIDPLKISPEPQRHSRKSSFSIESGFEELKRECSAYSKNSDTQSVASYESVCLGESWSSFPPGFSDIEMYLDESDATHRGSHKFLPRHAEELAVEIGDPLFVEKEHDDLWCEGINLRSKKRGVFPTVYATDLSLLGNSVKYKYFVSFLGSIEVGQHTGHDVLCKAIKKLKAAHKKSQNNKVVLSCLEIDESGIKIAERKKKTPTSRILSTIGKLSLLKSLQDSEHVFLLKNITFCGLLPRNDKYLGFITKHPVCMKFACHVFLAANSGRPIVEAIGNSLSKFHQEYLSVAYPVEDIYFE